MSLERTDSRQGRIQEICKEGAERRQARAAREVRGMLPRKIFKDCSLPTQARLPWESR